MTTKITRFFSLTLDHAQRQYGLTLGVLLVLSILVGACQTNTKDNNAFTSPISPLAHPDAKITSVKISDLDFTGCLLFTSNRTGDFEIYELKFPGNNLQQLTNSPGLDIDPAWSPAGNNIAFASNREGAGFQIYGMGSDGSNQQRLGPVQPGDNSHPSWSPDGQQLVFQSKRDVNSNPLDDNFDLYLMATTDGNVKLLTPDGADDTAPSWSPKGDQIAFLSERSGQDEVYLINPDGSNLKQLTELAILKSSLSWSNNGQYILFEGGGDIYAVNINTQEVTKLVSFKDSNEATPIWLANETLIFSSDRTGNWELYLLDWSNSELKLAQITDESGINRSPAWFACSQ